MDSRVDVSLKPVVIYVEEAMLVDVELLGKMVVDGSMVAYVMFIKILVKGD